MSKNVMIAIGIIVVLLIAGTGAYYLIQQRGSDSSPKPASTKSKTEQRPTPRQTLPPTEEITYPDGRTASVIAHQLIARINDVETVQSFRGSIKPQGPSGVYVITVEGDLLAKAAEISKKPGVVWVTPIDALRPISN